MSINSSASHSVLSIFLHQKPPRYLAPIGGGGPRACLRAAPFQPRNVEEMKENRILDEEKQPELLIHRLPRPEPAPPQPGTQRHNRPRVCHTIQCYITGVETVNCCNCGGKTHNTKCTGGGLQHSDLLSSTVPTTTATAPHKTPTYRHLCRVHEL